MVRASRASERKMGNAGSRRNAVAGGVHQDRDHQRSGVVRRREAGVLRFFLDSVRDRVHIVPLR
ncbi:hypothetical protein LINPERPRIM_LOCUS23165 [Linum perenne]